MIASAEPPLQRRDGLPLERDALGIWAAGRADWDYEDVPEPLLEACGRDIARLGMAAAVDRHFGDSNPGLGAFLTHPDRARFLDNLPSMNRGLAIEVGSGFGAISRHIARRFAEVIAIEPGRARIAFAQRWHRAEALDNVTAVAASIGQLEPPDGAADLVVFNGSLEWVALEDPRGEVAQAQRAALAWAATAVGERGLIYIAIENRFALYAWLGHPDPHTGVRFHSVVPRAVADWMTRLQHELPGQPRAPVRRYLTHTYSLGGYRRLLASAGLELHAALVPWPSYNRPRSFAGTGAELAKAYRDNRWYRLLAPLALRWPRIGFALAPGFGLLARRARAV